METRYYVAFVLYAILSIGVAAFVVWIFPPLVLSTYEFVSVSVTTIMQAYNDFVPVVNNHIINIRERFQFLAPSKGRHEELRFEELFLMALQEVREINEGRRTSVMISG